MRPAHAARRRYGNLALGATVAVAAVVIAVVVALVAVESGGDSKSPGPRATTTTQTAKPPPTAKPRSLFFVDPLGPAPEQVAIWSHDGHSAEAKQLARLADQPFPRWFTGGNQDTRGVAASLTTRAAAAKQIPLLVAYDIPGRDCGSFSAGGAQSDAEYRAFIDQLAAGIGQRRALIVLEPDAVAQIAIGCVDNSLIADRYADLTYAITTLRRDSQASVYLDAGNPGWITDPSKIAADLQKAGVASANGFTLNVSNFQTTVSNVQYGTAISAILGGEHFIIDTSRNGRGPYGSANDSKNWCNPPARAPGTLPTTATGNPLVDAFLWIKISGESDGSCHPGDPPAGTWWPAYALALAVAR